jgi:hypothetical protein
MSASVRAACRDMSPVKQYSKIGLLAPDGNAELFSISS